MNMSAKKDLQKTYNPGDIESKWYARWESGGHFAPARADAPPYCIMIPPPNVTGSLHMGHAFQDTIMDALIRYHRMRGRNTLWQPGTDHAGIATQMVVERILNAAGETRHDYGREKFTEKVWEWKAESGGAISRQLRRMGASPDWENERFTMDEGLCAAVNQVFVQLYEQGLIYRGKRLVNWDPALLTAVSDLEVVSEEESGVMYFVRYPFVDDEQNGVIIGTTRPETILVDGAIAVHPDDERFRPLLGRRVWVPMTEPRRAIEIIADEYVDPEFGSGCVKITAAHDFNDYRVYQRHPDKNIPLIVLLTPDAKMNDNAPERYRGLDRHKAREKIVADLREAGLLVREEAHRYKLPRGDRSGAVVEPMLTDQWFMDLTREQLEDGRPGGKAAIVEPAIEAVRGGAVEFVPQQWSKTYFQWLENLEDWCISRQIWWGHRIPAWYDDDGNIYVAANEAAVRKKYKLPADLALRQEEDVLDTWFSSALWPFSTLGWPEKTARLKTFYPGSVLVTGFDIIFFWVARMIMMGCKFMDKPPFDRVYIHGLVRDAHGQKMSKSKGNVLDPIDLIDGIGLDALVKKRTGGLMRPADAERIAAQTRADFPDGIPAFGADALRFTFASLASTGRDINFDLGRTEGSRHFCNKIWNAARFVLMHAEEKDGGEEIELGLADRWMLSKLQRAKTALQRAFETYRFDHAAKEIYELIWNHYCDWYLELCKPALQGGTAVRQRGVQHTLAAVLEEMLRLAHPFMPFLTEEIWQALAPVAGKSDATIMTQPYPQPQEEKIDAAAETKIGRVIEIVQAIRKLRSEHHIAPRQGISLSLKQEDTTIELPKGEEFDYLIMAMTNTFSFDGSNPAQTREVTSVVSGIRITLSIDSKIGIAEELERTEKELAELMHRLAHSTAKLANAEFVNKAPAAVVEKERARKAELEAKCAEMTKKRDNLRAQM